MLIATISPVTKDTQPEFKRWLDDVNAQCGSDATVDFQGPFGYIRGHIIGEHLLQTLALKRGVDIRCSSLTTKWASWDHKDARPVANTTIGCSLGLWVPDIKSAVLSYLYERIRPLADALVMIQESPEQTARVVFSVEGARFYIGISLSNRFSYNASLNNQGSIRVTTGWLARPFDLKLNTEFRSGAAGYSTSYSVHKTKTKSITAALSEALLTDRFNFMHVIVTGATVTKIADYIQSQQLGAAADLVDVTMRIHGYEALMRSLYLRDIASVDISVGRESIHNVTGRVDQVRNSYLITEALPGIVDMLNSPLTIVKHPIRSLFTEESKWSYST